MVGEDRTISFNAARYSTPAGHTGARVWCRMVGEQPSITAFTTTGDLSEMWRHPLSVSGSADHRRALPRPEDEGERTGLNTNAYRHTLWQARPTLELGEDRAIVWADAHEAYL
ncbi:hypothetical protein ABT144_05945 [Streptomyces sp. NPDC002039]|uniref:hypothetical protein n=1 Tax=Streptomyces sp. NPDC002039 TaxID=3154660 RepID=UPI003321C4C8